MAIRTAKCIRCKADAIVYGPGATLSDVTPGELVHIGYHVDNNGESCHGANGYIYPNYPLCEGCGEEIVDEDRVRVDDKPYHAECVTD